MRIAGLKRIVDWSRSEWLIAGAAVALVIGAWLPWYTLPADTLERFGASLWLPTALRLVPAIMVVVLLSVLFRSRHTFAFRTTLWSGLLIGLLFPFLMSMFAMRTCYVATAFDQQREGIAYHIETHYPDVQAQWKQSINLDPYEEIQSYAAEGLTRGYVDPMQTLLSSRAFSIDSGRFFQVSSWDRVIVEGLNYAPGFLGAAGWGWPVTVGALIVALFACYIAVPATMYSDWKRLWPWALGAAAIVLALIFVPSVVTRQISIWQARGEHGRACAAAKLLQALYPPMRGDVSFLLQKAESDLATQCANPSELCFAKGAECWRSNLLDEARTFFEQSLRHDAGNLLSRGYLAAVLLKIGVQQFEQGQPSAAAKTFEEVDRVFPHHLQATYCRMIAKAVDGDFAASAKEAAELAEMQRFFRLPGVAAIGQAKLHTAWAGYRANRLDEAWKSYRESVDKGAWQ